MTPQTGARPDDAVLPRPLAAAVPLLLLPVNVETRFMDGAKDNRDASELWVRVYPDQIAVDSHEPELTNGEVTDGKDYWDALWRAGNPPPRPNDVQAPWRGLATRYGAQRAAWIVLQMTPTNLDQRPAAPTPQGVAPAPAPNYAQPPLRNSSWEKAAVSRALPDAWTVVLFSGVGVKTIKGGAIASPLSVGLSPGGGAFPPGSPVDAGMTWLVDFDTALQAGMALKIPLTPQERASGFDRILVYGLRNAEPDGSQTLADLLDAHHYTDGFALVPQGAPTNNTPDASAAYSRKDPNYDTSFAVECQGKLTGDPESDGPVFASLLGIPASTLDHVRYADGTGSRNGSDMLTALWPATLGYFLSQMMAKVFSADQIELARQYALANAVPRGPLPAFRVGRTPYGVLPVTSLRLYKAGDPFAGSAEPALVDFLTRLLPTWLASSIQAPHLGGSGDPDQDLVGVLGMDASSLTFRGRQVLGDDFLWNLLLFLALPFPLQTEWWNDHFVRGRELLNRYGYGAWDPRVIHLALGEKGFPVSLPTVQAGPLSETEPLTADADSGGQKVNYITWLRSASLSDIQAENYPGPKPSSLLYQILRQSVLLDYVSLAGMAQVREGSLPAAALRETELVGIDPQQHTVTPWEILARPATPNPHLSWAEYLVSFDPPPQSPFARLKALRTSLDRLATLPTAELDRLVTETLDACSHRIDVWVTAVATGILKRARGAGTAGVHLGCFAWLENVRPAARLPAVSGSEKEAVDLLDERRRRATGINAPLPPALVPEQDNGGFILAPSDAQAAVAAVLRNGYLTHKGTSEEGLLSIDLSSERVRRALGLMDGISQGQSLAALLGYRFETELHDLGFDKYTQPFRDRFPLVGDKLTPSSDPAETVAASNIVDGLALRTAWDQGNLPIGGNWGTDLPPAGADQNAVVGMLRDLDDQVDALADLSLAESVFQIIRGNFGRAGGLMDAVSRGLRPPEAQVVNTPRGGLDITHRLLLLCAGDPATAPAWAGVAQHRRAAAEPWLDAWLSTLLPDPAQVRCAVQYKVGGADQTKVIRLVDLDVGPLDILALADAAETPQQSELEERILYQAALPAAADTVNITFQPNAVPAGSIVFPDLLVLSRMLRDLLGAARALSPQDLTLPERKAEDGGGAIILADLNARAATLLQGLQQDVATLQGALGGLPGAPGPVRTALWSCSYYGVSGAIPHSSAGPDPGLATQANAVLTELQKRLTTAIGVPLPAATPDGAVSVIQAILGNGFVVLPRFTPPDFASLKAALAQSDALIASDPPASSRWFAQLSQIRSGVSRLDAALVTGQVLSRAQVPALLLGQLPAVAQDRWLGLPLDGNAPFVKGRVALACVTAGDPLGNNSYCGLLLDEWPERIPNSRESAAVAFHQSEPRARAPQSLLLAVCPDDRELWDDELVQAILADTLDLAKARTVDLASVQEIGQILPALYFALNLQAATVSTHFSQVSRISHVP